MSRPEAATLSTELAVITAQLELLRTQETELQQHIDGLQAYKNTISARRRALEVKEFELEASRHPVNWLPIELLVDVFLSFVEDDNSAFILTHVCQKWREVALTTPRLWTCISTRSTRWNSNLVALALERSRDCLLDVVLDDRSTDPSAITLHLETCVENYKRIRNCTMHAPEFLSVEKLATIINQFPCVHLRSLSLSVMTKNPIPLGTVAEPSPDTLAKPSIPLTHLGLTKVPLAFLSQHLLTNIVTLTMCYPPTARLMLTDLTSFLSFIPGLEELVLLNTSFVPPPSVVQAIKLPSLRCIEWSYPRDALILQLFTALEVPALQRLDLWIDSPNPRYHTSQPNTNVCVLPSLEELLVQCTDEDAMGSVLRKFAFPVLRKLELTNADERLRLEGIRSDSLPLLPRMESLFRDPRQPQLTHLTLSHYMVTPNAEAMLGYVPALVSLSLDACTGIKGVLESLMREAVGTEGVKYCSKLERLSFWSCRDLEKGVLERLVRTRNLAGRGTWGGERKIRPPPEERRIRPLPSKRVGGMAHMKPVPITYLRVEDCPNVTAEEMSALSRELGVVDIAFK
ncbi:hypothetical protein ARMSODRAFT_311565 [Armillaria solidipes]|uniref:Uncharacterized protein n=1 Tax=Armillaria solidipes TaxID=1076256 RepID=A0A2H3BSD5_9AGAR|nr:hypothetical protein ARMSODRAFT_311565 [Armillaria solidipes]